MRTLKNSLMEWTSNTIKKYVALLDGTSSIALKGKRADFICQKLLNKPSLRLIWSRFDSVTQQAISNAYHNGGEFNKDAFIAQYGKLPPRPKKRGSWSYDREPVLFDIFVINGQIADDLMLLLADLILPLERFQLEGVKEVPSTYEGYKEWDITAVNTEIIGRADLLTYLQLVEQKQVKFGAKNKRLTAASVRKVLKNLMDGDFCEEREQVTGKTTIRPFGLDVFTQESGLMTRTGKLTKAGREYLYSQNTELMLNAVEKWSDSGRFDELTRLKQLGGLKSRGVNLTPAASRREKIIEALSWCPVDTWIDIQDFYRALVIWDFDFEVQERGYQSLYIGSRHYGELYDKDYWAVAHGLYINAIIWEYLGTMGAVDVAFVDDEYTDFIELDHYNNKPISLFDGLIYFRINPWGAFLLGQANEYTPAQPKQKSLFVINANKKLRLLDDMLPNERLQLEAMAEKIDDKTYLLSDTMVLTAVESGQQLDHIIPFLQANHAGELPAAISDWLAQLKKNEGAFTEVGTAVLVRLKPEKLMSLTKTDPTLTKLCTKIDKNSVLVRLSHRTRFRNRLKELGYLLS